MFVCEGARDAGGHCMLKWREAAQKLQANYIVRGTGFFFEWEAVRLLKQRSC